MQVKVIKSFFEFKRAITTSFNFANFVIHAVLLTKQNIVLARKYDYSEKYCVENIILLTKMTIE